MSRLEEFILASGALPDVVLRSVVRSRVLRAHSVLDALSEEELVARSAALLREFEAGPMTVHANDANRQHYEVPADFFRLVLGPQMKYSCCYWPAGVTDLAGAEEAMLELTADRAGLDDGQTILDLGCGWGSLALWAAQRYPDAQVTAMSNSHGQRRFIESQRDRQGLTNLKVATAEVTEYSPDVRFDRVVSVEMLEHVRNHRALLARVEGWLEPEGRFFAHVFCHRQHVYAFEPGGWMTDHFFSGGMMPSWDYLARYQDDLRLVRRWEIEGTHYARTLRAWLTNLDRRRKVARSHLATVCSPQRARLQLAYWRVFFMSCEETFAMGSGREYHVGHYLFEK